MALQDSFSVSANSDAPVRLDSSTFRLLVEPVAPSPLQRWNGLLGDLIAANPIGPTRSSRAFALLNSGFYDLWAATDGAARPVYAPAEMGLLSGQLEPALHQFAARLLLQWFPASTSVLDRELQAVGEPGLIAGGASTDLLAVVQRQLQALPVLDPWASGSQPKAPASTREITVWWPEHVPIDNPSAPLQKYLTPAWGTLQAFSTSDITQWRPAGPEPFLLVSGDQATLNLASASLELPHEWISPGGQLRTAGSYDIRDPSNQQWLLGELINPAFVQQAQRVVDFQRDLTDEQKLIAEFWENGAGTPFPPGTWMAITSLMAEQQHLSLTEQIKLFFGVGQAVGDAGIAAWDAKAAFNYARPVRAIRDLASLNLLTGDDLLSWDTYQKPGGASSPAFPDYVSGHSTFSAAAAEVLSQYLGSDALNLSLTFQPGSSRFEGGITPDQVTTLAWSTFSEAADSAGLSRLYGGIHFSDANLDGQALGRTVGDAVLSRASSLAYADLTKVLQEPFLLRNSLELRRDLPALLDGQALPVELEEIHLAGGDDRVSLADGVSFSGGLDGGAGIDLITYSAFKTPVRVDLGLGQQATGVLKLQGFENVVGGVVDDVLLGSSADNRLEGGGGDDWIVGGPGLDTAVFRGERSDYRFERDQVIDQRDSGSAAFDGRDRIVGIEQLSFANGTWPVEVLFQPVSTSVILTTPATPQLLREGQAVTLEFLREGDLQDSIQLQLAWQLEPEDRLGSSDLNFTGSGMQFTLPAGQRRTSISLPTLDDTVFEGTEVGHLRISSAQMQPAADLPIAPQVSWTTAPLELVVLDNDSPPPPTAFQRVQSSPLPLLVAHGRELSVPLTYSVSDQAQNLAGLSFQVHYPASGLQFAGFEPASKATQAASLWAAVDQTKPGDQGSVQISFASVEAAWPGQLGAALPLPLGTVKFAVASEFSATDALTGLSFSPVDLATGYGFQAKAPSLQLAKNWSLDVDGDGVVRPLSDGLMVMRYLMGMQGSALTQKAMSPMGSRSTSASVAAWIERGRQDGMLDFDGDGRTTALGDGLMLMRAMFGMQGDALLSKAVSSQSPLLAGNRYDQLSPDDKLWVGQQVLDRVDTLR